MERVEWTSEFLTGIDEIDEQHRAFVGIINKLALARAHGLPPDMAYRQAYELHAYAEYHFICEDNLMIARRWPLRTEHQQEHARISHMLKIKVGCLAKGVGALSDIAAFAHAWLVSHTLREDLRFARFLRTGSSDPPGESADGNGKQTTSRIFRVDQREATDRIRRLSKTPQLTD